jgi:hypothetical protein
MDERTWLTSNDPGAMRLLIWPRAHCGEGTGPGTDRQARLYCAALIRTSGLPLDGRGRARLAEVERKADAGPRGLWDEGVITQAALPADYQPGNYAARSAALIDPGDAVKSVLLTFREAGQPPAAGAALLRDIAGNPFAPPPPASCTGGCRIGSCRCVRSWRTRAVLGLARAIYAAPGSACRTCEGKGGSWFCPNCHGEWYGDVGPDCFVCSAPRLERHECTPCQGTGRAGDGLLDPVRLLMLSDALEDAGADASLLSHLRGSGPHCRGCWALDYLLGKE